MERPDPHPPDPAHSRGAPVTSEPGGSSDPGEPSAAASSTDPARKASGPEPLGPAAKWRAELKEALSARTVALVLGVLVLQLGFIWSYVGAFHHPAPHRIPIEVTGPSADVSSAVRSLNSLPGRPLRASPASSLASAETALRRGRTDGVLAIGAASSSPNSAADRLLVAGGDGAALSEALVEVMTAAEHAAHRSLSVVDLVPAQPGDARGLTGFYLVVGWLVGGYLVASLLGVAKGALPATTSRAILRLGALVPYCLASGLGGALIVGPVLSALRGHTLALWLLGSLVVYAAASVTVAFEVLAGVVGIGLAVAVFVILGNPSAGGAYQAPLLPGFWRAINPALPNGAAVTALRQIVYFGSFDIGSELLVLAAYAAAGTVASIGIASLKNRTRQP